MTTDTYSLRRAAGLRLGLVLTAAAALLCAGPAGPAAAYSRPAPPAAAQSLTAAGLRAHPNTSPGTTPPRVTTLGDELPAGASPPLATRSRPPGAATCWSWAPTGG